MKKQSLRFVLFCLCILAFAGVGRAQESTPDLEAFQETETPFVTDEPTVVPTDTPTDTPTEVPTDVPTEPEPTAAPTDLPTDVPTDLPTEEPTDEPTPENLAPVFSFPDNNTAFEVVAGNPFTFQATVQDNGPVHVNVDVANARGIIGLSTSQLNAEQTQVEIIYTAPVGTEGVDAFLLQAVDADGASSTVLITMTVLPAPATEEVTPEMTDEPATEPLLIKYGPNATDADIAAMVAALNGVEVGRIPQLRIVKVLVPPVVADPASAAASLASSPASRLADIQFVEGEVLYTLDYTTNPNDPLFRNRVGPPANYQWALSGANSIYADYAWGQSTNAGSGIVVAVVDSGIDLTHPDLDGKIVPGYDFVNADSTPQDGNSHGTHVSGIIAAETNNGSGMAGVAPNAQIMPIKSFDDAGNGNAFDIAAGIVFAVDNGADVVNMSFTSPAASRTTYDAIQYGLSRNVIMVAASGNTGSPLVLYPAAFPEVLSIGATTPTGTLAGFSNPVTTVDFVAPGDDIISTVPGGYGVKDGTSMASPHVAGVVALILSDGVANTPNTVYDALLCSAAPLAGNPVGSGNGLIQADFALNWKGDNAGCDISPRHDVRQTSLVIPKTDLPFNHFQEITPRITDREADDPVDICGVTDYTQSLWYRFRPATTGGYLFSTLGSNYDTVMAVYEADQASFNQSNCNAGFMGNQAAIGLQLDSARMYYILIANQSNSEVSAMLQLQVTSAIETWNTDFQETSSVVQTVGDWRQSRIPEASDDLALTSRETTDRFMYLGRGRETQITMISGPEYVGFDIYVDGVYAFTPSGTGARVRQRVFTHTLPLTSSSGYHIFTLVPISTVSPYRTAIDKIRMSSGDALATRPVITGTVDDRSTSLLYLGPWTDISGGGYYSNTARTTSTVDAAVEFRANGNYVQVFREVGASNGSMDVYVDGKLWTTVDNTVGTYTSSPYSIVGIPKGEHIIRIERLTGTLTIDKIVVGTLTALTTGTIDDTDVRILYNGIWSRPNVSGALNGRTRRTNDQKAFAFALVNGNNLCIRYLAQPGGAVMQVQLRPMLQTWNIPTVSAVTEFRQWCSPLQRTYAQHQLFIIPASTGPLEIDSIQVGKAPILIAGSGKIDASGSSFAGFGFSPITDSIAYNNTLLRATTVGSGLKFNFYGDGFVLYLIDSTNAANVEIYVNGVRQSFNVDGSTYNHLVMRQYPRRIPTAYAVSMGVTGVYEVEIRHAGSGGQVVDVDAVRVFIR